MKLLTVHPTNPRYFTDGSGKAVYLTGSHTWANLQDHGPVPRPGDPPPVFDWAGYLDLLEEQYHNFIRLWAWEQAAWMSKTTLKVVFDPMPYQRTGPGMALDDQPRFDLQQFNQAYFDRLRSRVADAGECGIYVGVMLFQGFSPMKKDLSGRKTNQPGNPWLGHPFHRENNINGVDGDVNDNGQGEEVHSLDVPAVTRLQEAYVRKVVDTVNDLDNVLYEVANESHIESKEWQYHIVRYLKEYEAGKPKQHLAGISSFYAGREGAMDAVLASPADWVSPHNEGGRHPYHNDPPAADGQKVLLSDTDHIFGVGGDDTWVWKTFCRGLHPIYMDPFGDRAGFRDWLTEWEDYEAARRAMGQTRRYAEKMDLAAMTPQDVLVSTGYCLAASGAEYLVYQPESGPFTVDLTGCVGALQVEWFDPQTGEAGPGESIGGGGVPTLTPPFGGTAVVHLVASA
ncbi:MAG: hypothetical protein CL878_08835 [Dehalococcoidia bacterium]|nr:hypothetical protein [Dehalococcoidia bacterium]